MAARRYTIIELRSPDRAAGDEFEALVVLRKCVERIAKTGTPFFVVELGDRTGSFSANVFSGADRMTWRNNSGSTTPRASTRSRCVGRPAWCSGARASRFASGS
jgi:hypothetical protein